MDLLEYQAKELFRDFGIPVLPSQRIDHPTDLKDLQIPYPVVLKSQVPTGGRGKAGGIRFVENTIDAIATARTIFNLSILSQYPRVLLAESRYEAKQEFYLAVVLDYALGRPVLLGSSQGGIDLEGVMAHLQRVIVEQEFSPFYARRLTLKMGLQGRAITSVSEIVEKMYQLFVRKDLDVVEINPLGISATGEVMALDGKITVNDHALGRHTDLATLAGTTLTDDPVQVLSPPHLTKLNEANAKGNIGILCNGTCLAAATLDLVYQAKGRPASCLAVGKDGSWDLPSEAIPQLLEALDQVTEAHGIKVVLVNILGSAAACETVVEAIANYLLSRIAETPVLSVRDRMERPTGLASRAQRDRPTQTSTIPRQPTALMPLPHLVIRIVGGKIGTAAERLAAIPIHWMDNLDEAVAHTVALAKSTVI